MQVAVALSVSLGMCLLPTYSRCSLADAALTSPNRVVGSLLIGVWTMGVCVRARTYPALTAMTAMIGTAWKGENLIKMIWFSSHFVFALNSNIKTEKPKKTKRKPKSKELKSR